MDAHLETSKKELLSERILSFFIRLSVWVLLFAVIYILRSFFLLMFLTFIFAYIQGHAVYRLKHLIRPRAVRVVLVAVFFLGLLTAIGAFFVPRVKHQAGLVAANYDTYLAVLDRELFRFAHKTALAEVLLGGANELGQTAAERAQDWDPRRSPTLILVQSWLGLGEEVGGAETFKYLADLLTDLGRRLLEIISAFLLSLLLSFLVVLDLPRLTRSTRELARTKVGFIYEEVAENIATFGRELGRAFEAQTLIALVNTLLTAIGLWLLGLTGKTAFISVIVFFCSFVPLAGVFISSVPICLVALQESGAGLMVMAILMITMVHLIEAYILNPRIYGQHMHMNPVLVLTVLTIAGKLFGVWGLVLGIPVCTYVFRHAIRFRPVKGVSQAA